MFLNRDFIEMSFFAFILRNGSMFDKMDRFGYYKVLVHFHVLNLKKFIKSQFLLI
jgi:hypothetical protein